MRNISVLLAFLLAACATAPPMAWIRLDGQRMANNAVLAQQFDVDKTICQAEREKADLSGVTVANGGFAGLIAAQNRSNAADVVAKGCMAEKGYALVRADQAEAELAEFAAINAQKQAQLQPAQARR